MRTLKFNIATEDYCSRLPGVTPAYEGDNLYYFDIESLTKDYYQHKSNYSMYPLNLVLSGITLNGDSNSDWSISAISGWSGCGIAELSDSYTCDSAYTIDWNHVSDIFGFFRKYYSLLNDDGSCGLAYSSATDYYATEIKSKYGDANLLYGNDEETYIEFDDIFQRYGGEVSALTVSDVHEDYKQAKGSIHEPIAKVIDVGFFGWLCNNVVPAFHVPKKYADEYKSHLLFYPDAISLYGLLYRLSLKYDKITEVSGCGETDDCCECQKYFDLGGKDMLNKLKAWIDSVNTTIEKNNKLFTNNLQYECPIPVIDMQISLSNSIEDLGELSIFSKEWEGGVDYSMNVTSTVSPNITKIQGGTTVVKDDKTYIIKNSNKGYKYDERYCEFIWGNDTALTYDKSSSDEATYNVDSDSQWLDYTEAYLNASGASFSSSVETYAYDINDCLRMNPTHEKMAQNIDVSTNDGLGYILYYDQAYEIFESESVLSTLVNNPYLNGKIFIVEREAETNTPYVTISNKKVYADLSDDMKYYFYFNSHTSFEKNNINQDSIKKFVTINGVNYVINNYSIACNMQDVTQTYPQIDGLFTYDDIEWYLKDDQVVSLQANCSGSIVTNTVTTEKQWISIPSSSTIELDEDKYYYWLDDATSSINVVKHYDVHLANYVTGICLSNIELVKGETSYDDLGNILDGYYDTDSENNNYAQPTAGAILDLAYNVGNAIAKKQLSDGNYIGNIISSMTFYYCNYDGTQNNNFVISCNLTNRKTSLSAIQDLEKKYKENYDKESPEPIESTIHCDITYNIGASLKLIGNNWQVVDGTHAGVEYTEKVTFIKQPEQYYLAENNSYTIFCYLLVQETTTFNSSVYGDITNAACAYFKMQICTLNDKLDKDIFTSDKGFENNNGLMVSPVFRQEYMLNVSQPESITSNVQIDRGANSAFEKHIKLGEITTFEALENYGNGYFNMLDT